MHMWKQAPDFKWLLTCIRLVRGKKIAASKTTFLFSASAFATLCLPLRFLGIHQSPHLVRHEISRAMSGLEPLAALSLAYNVVQLVQAGLETINLIKTVYRRGTADVTLNQTAAILGSLSDEIKTCKRPAKCPKYEQQLLIAAEKCSTAARDLREEIQFLVRNAKHGSLASTLKEVAKTNWRRRRLERLKESLDSTGKLMQTTLLTQIW